MKYIFERGKRMHIRIQKNSLTPEKRVALFRKTGILCKKSEDSSWELLLPAGVVIVMNDNSTFWVFDTRKDVMIGVIEEYSDQEGGTLRLV